MPGPTRLACPDGIWWSLGDSNLRPPRCERGALPLRLNDQAPVTAHSGSPLPSGRTGREGAAFLISSASRRGRLGWQPAAVPVKTNPDQVRHGAPDPASELARPIGFEPTGL